MLPFEARHRFIPHSKTTPKHIAQGRRRTIRTHRITPIRHTHPSRYQKPILEPLIRKNIDPIAAAALPSVRKTSHSYSPTVVIMTHRGPTQHIEHRGRRFAFDIHPTNSTRDRQPPTIRQPHITAPQQGRRWFRRKKTPDRITIERGNHVVDVDAGR